MLRYAPGVAIPVTFTPEVPAGATVRWRVLDENDAVVVSWSPAPAGVDGKITVTLEAENTALADAVLRGMRIVVLGVGDNLGPANLLRQRIVLERENFLQVGINSFQTYDQAVLGAMDFAAPELIDGWNENDDEPLRVAALTEAYDRLCRLPIIVEWDNSQNTVREITVSPPRLRDYTPAQILALDPKLLRALRQAQVVEASQILANDPVARARADGLVSRTVGESSEFFGSSKGFTASASGRAMAFLRRWLRFGARLARA